MRFQLGASTSLLAVLVLVASASGFGPSARSAKNGKIAFQSTRGGNLDLYVMNADGTHQVRLTTSRADDCCRPVWSPNGRKIAFMSERDGNGEIYVMNADGSNQRRLTKNSATDFFPSWSPDGRRIAFSKGGGQDRKSVV